MSQHYAKLIEATTKEQFDSIVKSFIEAYWEIEIAVIVDGKGDGGTDLKVFTSEKSHLKIPIQITVERSPYIKLTKDLAKVERLIKNFNYSDTLYFFSSHTISEAKLQEITSKARTNHGITLNFIDSKFIASKIIDKSFSKTLGVVQGLFSALLTKPENLFSKVEKLKFNLLITKAIINQSLELTGPRCVGVVNAVLYFYLYQLYWVL